MKKSQRAQRLLKHDKLLFSILKQVAKNVPSQCSERNINIMLDYYLTSESLDELSEDYGITRERARQIIIQTLEQMASGIINRNDLEKIEQQNKQLNQELKECRNKLISYYREEQNEEQAITEAMKISLDNADQLMVYLKLILQANRIGFIGQLAKYSEKEISKWKNVGTRALHDIKVLVSFYGFKLKKGL